ncbi:MAG: CHAT domain-containing protein [Candidatus Eremiobacteraeota bacterium]|nr:CHAT domain-containing protein [Candidatus Eremiobacteraeota bacterium]
MTFKSLLGAIFILLCLLLHSAWATAEDPRDFTRKTLKTILSGDLEGGAAFLASMKAAHGSEAPWLPYFKLLEGQAAASEGKSPEGAWDEALALFRSSNDAWGVGVTLLRRGSWRKEKQQNSEAEKDLEESGRLLKAEKEHLYAGAAEFQYALLCRASGRAADADKAMESAILSFQRAGDTMKEGAACLTWSSSLFLEGKYEKALTTAEKAAELLGKTDNTHFYGLALVQLSNTLAMLGREEEGLAPLEKALLLPLDKETEAQVLETKGETLFSLGRGTQALGAYEKALAACEKNGEKKAGLHLKRATILHTLGKVKEALQEAAEARAIYASSGNRPGEAKALLMAGDIAFERCQAEQGFQDYEKALRLAAESGDRALEAKIQAYTGVQWYFLGDYQKAVAPLLKACAYYDAAKNPALVSEACYALVSLGNLFAATGDGARGEEALKAALALSTALNYREGVLSALESLATLAMARGDAPGAEKIFKQALEKAQSGGLRLRLPLLETALGGCCEHMSRIEEAKAHYEASLSLNRSLGYRKGEASDLVNIGFMAYWHRGDMDAAEKEYRKALAIYEELDDPRGIVMVLQFIGDLYKNRGHSPEALAYYRKALDLAEEKGLERERGVAQYTIGYYLLILGDPEKGFSLMEEAARFFASRGLVGDAAQASLNLADIILLNLGNAAKARKHLSSARALFEKTGDREGLWQCRLTEAKILGEENEFEESALEFHRLYQEARKAGNLRLIVTYLMTLLSMSSGTDMLSPELLLGYASEALALSEQAGEVKINILLSLAVAGKLTSLWQYDMAYLDKAQALLEKASKEAERLRNPELSGDILIGLADLAFEREDLEDAEKKLLHAEKLVVNAPNLSVKINERLLRVYCRNKDRQKAGEIVNTLRNLSASQSNIRQKSEILKNIILYYSAVEDYDSIAPLLREKSAFDRLHYRVFEQVPNLSDQGLLAEKEGDRKAQKLPDEAEKCYQKALDYYDEAIKLSEKLLGTIKSEAKLLELSESLQSPYGGTIRILLRKNEKEKAFGLSERDRARAFLQTVGRSFWPAPSGGKVREKMVSLMEGMREYEGLLNALSKPPGEAMAGISPVLPGAEVAFAPTGAPETKRSASFAGRSSILAPPEVPKSYIDQYYAKYQEALAILNMENQRLYHTKAVKPASLAAIQEDLDDDTVMLAYYVEARETFLFIITRHGMEAKVIGKNHGDLRSLTNDAKSLIRRDAEKKLPESSAMVKKKLSELHALLIAPAEPFFEKAKRLVIVPHRFLNNLPFSALLDRSGKPLVMDRTIVTLPSASVLVEIRKRPGAPPGSAHLVAFALGNEKVGSMSPLPATKLEVEKLGALFPSASLKEEKEFTRDSVREYAPGASYLHFATHGVLNERNPLLSGIATCDGVMNLNDLGSINLGHCRLATLSACETALGRITSGDDMIGISRTLIYCGAPTVLASLWSVADESTAKLMGYFYEALARSTGKDEALREAQVRLIKEYPLPFHWAPFIMIGDWK